MDDISLNIPTRINPEAEPTFATLKLTAQIAEELSKALDGAFVGRAPSPEAVERIERRVMTHFPNCTLKGVVITPEGHTLTFIGSEKDFADHIEAEYGEK